jgi:hypothetical protein
MSVFGVVILISFVGSPPAAPPAYHLEKGRERSQSMWRNEEETSDFLVLLGFDSNQAAEYDLRKIVEAESFTSTEENMGTEVHNIKIVHQHGYVLDQVPAHAYMAMTKTISNPGYSDISREMIEEVVASFTQLEGYCGHLIGYNETVEEEVWSLAFGTSVDDVPMYYNDDAVTKLYRRVR